MNYHQVGLGLHRLSIVDVGRFSHVRTWRLLLAPGRAGDRLLPAVRACPGSFLPGLTSPGPVAGFGLIILGVVGFIVVWSMNPRTEKPAPLNL